MKLQGNDKKKNGKLKISQIHEERETIGRRGKNSAESFNKRRNLDKAELMCWLVED